MSSKSITLHLDLDQRTFSVPARCSSKSEPERKSPFRSARTSFTTRSSVSGSFFFFSLSFSFSSVSFFGHPRHPVTPCSLTVTPCYIHVTPLHANICVFVLLSFSVPPQNYGLHGPQIGSICQTHVVIFPISTLQTFLEQFVLVIVVSCL